MTDYDSEEDQVEDKEYATKKLINGIHDLL